MIYMVGKTAGIQSGAAQHTFHICLNTTHIQGDTKRWRVYSQLEASSNCLSMLLLYLPPYPPSSYCSHQTNNDNNTAQQQQRFRNYMMTKNRQSRKPRPERKILIYFLGQMWSVTSPILRVTCFPSFPAAPPLTHSLITSNTPPALPFSPPPGPGAMAYGKPRTHTAPQGDPGVFTSNHVSVVSSMAAFEVCVRACVCVCGYIQQYIGSVLYRKQYSVK